ncbi:Molybdenum transport system permease protein ModB [Pseudidiomarina piscicola]|uniref:Molybdenum transport system permease protein ModB n=1 Tax=Pseudidiomarina piscicola TaxID=2614830 RepID=A0A7D9N2M0_9GAMM|nr:iron ABC transporter permease [Pseudidiomarina piscicola]CAB0149491.1 Molybdenum transport system permease protein ModB [Pseudidiomarina piscicola]VZT38935.1 Molybdenum transport system permease protein ModB [Pseudomonas aeruginosa]
MAAKWRQLSLVASALVLGLPLFVIVAALLQLVVGGDFTTLSHLWQTVIPEYVRHSLMLMIGVAIGVIALGVGSAWLTTSCRFPGQRILSWALLLPLAMPAYITAYTYTGMLDYSGVVQTSLRDLFDLSYGDYWFPQIRSVGGAIVVLSLVLFPYVYLITRATFLQQSATTLEAGRSLGLSPWQCFWRIALPLARPAIVTGTTLALMETLADYGTVQYFGVTTFTTGIFRTWYGLGDLSGALQLAGLLLVAVIALILIERWSRKQARYDQRSSRPAEPFQLSGGKAWLASAACWLPLVFGFILPALQLAGWSVERWQVWTDIEFWQLAWNSFALAFTAALLVVTVALWLAYGRRQLPTRWVRSSVAFAGLGYAIPGLVIAVGLLVLLSSADQVLISFSQKWFGWNPGLLLSGTLFALIFAYTVRFLSVALQTVQAGLAEIRPSMDEAARIHGYRPFQVLRAIHLPLLRPSVLTAIILVGVDVLKELPATLVLRPFDFNTLAVRAYEMAGDERLADAGPPALMMVLVGLIPVILLSRAMLKSQQNALKEQDFVPVTA